MKNNTVVKDTIKYFFPIAWRFKKGYFIIAILNMIAQTITPFINILVLPYLIDELLGDKDISKLMLYAGIIVFGEGILGLITSFLSITLEKYDHLFRNYFTEQMSKRAMSLDFQLTEDKEALDQSEKASRGMRWMSGGVHGIATQFFNIITAILKIIGVIIIVIVNAPLMLVFTLVLTLIEMLITMQKNKIEVEAFKKAAHSHRAFGYFSWELADFRNGKDIRLYDAKDMMLGKWNSFKNENIRVNKEQTDKTVKYSVLGTLPTVAKDILSYLYLGVLVIAGKITIGVYSQMLSSGATFYSAVSSLITSMQEIVKRSNYAYEYIKFMDYSEAIEKGEKHIENKPHTIEFRHVTFTYPKTDVKVLDDISITLKQGDHLSIVGLNGAGKTTFVKLLCRLYDPTDGDILLDGVSIKEYNYEEYMSIFAPVFQDFKLFSFSMRENIDLKGNASNDDLIDIINKVGLSQKLDSFENGLDTLLFRDFDKNGVEPSGGEQQKIAIARALFKNSPTVILDEPTAALDPVAEYDIYRQFNALVGGRTAIYISHRLSSCRFCDNIAVFHDGTIKEYGPHEKLIDIPNGIYAKMFNAQAEYYR